MPKMKTHKGAKKRIKVTAHGKIRRYPAGGRKQLSKKSGKRKRHLMRPGVIEGASADKLRYLVDTD